MGKTYKRVPTGVHRHPKGYKQAVINKARHGSIPPNSYDDLMHDHHTYIPYNVALRMLKEEIDENLIVKKLVRKFRLRYNEAIKIVKNTKKHLNRDI